MYFFKEIKSPVGRLTLIASSEALVGVLWEREREGRVTFEPRVRDDDHPVLVLVEEQLRQYFAGARTGFEIPLAFVGTEFQKKVWAELLRIPYGETRSYSQIANALGNPGAVRAVGAANGRNPLSILAPCHRVVGANGSLTGFAGGLEAKQFLLSLETTSV